MDVVILAGGFAKRMWPLTINQPKHLLNVAGKPVLDYVIKNLEGLNELERIFISTNARFESQFSDYQKSRGSQRNLLLFIEDTYSENEKLGSIGALGDLIRKNKLNDDLLVIGGDNIFNFKMPEFINYFRKVDSNVVALYDVKSIDKARLYGVVCLDSRGMIVNFQEKPINPKSTLVSTACYVFNASGVQSILQYLNEGNDADKMGHLIEWLSKNNDVFGFLFKGVWFDIGSFEGYYAANKYLSKRAKIN